MTLIKSIHHVVIYVTNMNEAINFYTEILEMKLGYKSDMWTEVSFLTPGSYIGLHYTKEGNSKSIGTEVSFEVTDIHSVRERLLQNKVNFTSDVLEAAPGKLIANFLDPFGNPLSIYETI